MFDDEACVCISCRFQLWFVVTRQQKLDENSLYDYVHGENIDNIDKLSAAEQHTYVQAQ